MQGSVIGRFATPALAVRLAACVLLAAAPGSARAGEPDPIEIRIQAVRVSDDDGGRPAAITPAEVETWLAEANLVYAPAAIRFRFDPQEDFDEVRSTLLNGMTGTGDARWQDEVDAGNAIAAAHPGKALILFRHGPGEGPSGGGFSATDYDFVAAPGFTKTSVCGHQNLGLLAHELGHFLGLAHTFALQFQTREEAERTFVARGKEPAIFDGDGLDDTPPDPMIDELQCVEDDTVVLAGVTLPIARTNIMSYWEAPHRALTPQQIVVVRFTAMARARGGGSLPRNVGVEGAIEGESLVAKRQSRLSAAPQDMTGWGRGRWSGDGQLWCGGEDGGVLGLDVPVAAAGRYRVVLYGTAAPDFARVQFRVDGKAAGRPFDFWAPTVQPTGPVDLGPFRLRRGAFTLTAEIRGHRKDSRGFGFGLDCLALVRVR